MRTQGILYAFSIVSRRLASGLFPKYVNIFRSSSISILEVCRVWLEEKKYIIFSSNKYNSSVLPKFTKILFDLGEIRVQSNENGK